MTDYILLKVKKENLKDMSPLKIVEQYDIEKTLQDIDNKVEYHLKHIKAIAKDIEGFDKDQLTQEYMQVRELLAIKNYIERSVIE